MKYFLWLGLVFWISSSVGQRLNRKYLHELFPNLAGEVYNVLMHEGEVWFITEKGSLCRFNGLKTRCYSNQDLGMTNIYKQLYSSNGILHVYDSYANVYASFQNNEWHVHHHNISSGPFGIETIFQDSMGTYRQLKWNGKSFEKVDQKILDSLVTIEGIEIAKVKAKKCNIIVTLTPNNEPPKIENPISLNSVNYIRNNIFQIKENQFGYIGNDCNLNYFDFNYHNSKISNTCVSEPYVALSNDHPIIYSMSENKVICQLEDEIINIFDVYNHIFFTATHSGLTLNTNGILFFKSGNEGMVNNNHVVGEDNNGNIWFGGYKSGLSYFDGKKITRIPKFNSRNDNFLSGSCKVGDELILLTENYGMLTSIKDGHINHKAIKSNSDRLITYDIKQLSNSYLAFGTYRNGLGLVQTSNLFLDSIAFNYTNEGIELTQIFNIEDDQKGRIWMASQSEGLAVYDPVKNIGKSYLIQDNKLRRFGVTSLLLDDEDNLWLGTFEGLKVIENISNLSIETSDPYDLMKDVSLFPPEGNTTALLQKDSLIIAAAENEIWFLNLKQYYAKSDSFTAYSYSYKYDLQGRTSEENGSMIDSKGNIWIGTQEGYLCFDSNNLYFDNDSINIHIDSYEIADSTFVMSGNKIELPPGNRNFSFTYNTSYNPDFRINYYILTTIFDNQNDTVFHEIYDPSKIQNRVFLDPGEYKMVSKVYKNNIIVDYDEYKVLSKAYISESPWFFTTISTLFFSIIFYIFLQRKKRQSSIIEMDLELEKIKRQQSKTQLQSVISSFNPHFINNSLHWAQSRYSEDKEMVKVIGRLSENIEHIFVKSTNGKAYHSLKEELRLVENYVEIQKVRFNNTFDYIPPINKDEFSNYMIPIMQLQIHVENAIEHGLRNRIDSSYVSISIEKINNSIKYSIEDDGIGRIESKKMKSQSTQKGTSMLEKLHNIINSNNVYQINQYYKDNIFGTFGTRVIIIIPTNINYEL